MSIIERLETCASESEMGRNFADTPRACREAAATIAALVDTPRVEMVGGTFYSRILAEYRTAITSVKQICLAEELGVSQPRVSQMRKETNPTIQLVDRVLSAVARVNGGRP